jgi:hypothetical protein
MIVKITPVPEGSSLLMVGGGLPHWPVQRAPIFRVILFSSSPVSRLAGLITCEAFLFCGSAFSDACDLLAQFYRKRRRLSTEGTK